MVALAQCDTLPCSENISYPIRRRKRQYILGPFGPECDMRARGLGRGRWEACEEKGGGGSRTQAGRGNAEFA